MIAAAGRALAPLLAAGGGPWAALVLLGAVAALALDAADRAVPRGVRGGRAVALAGLAVLALWAHAIAWSPAVPERFTLLATSWWLLVVPAWALGASVASARGPSATARLAVTQAAPAVFLSFATLPAMAPFVSFCAGFLRLAAPPLHPMVLESTEALPIGAAGLFVLLGLVLGGPLAARGALDLGEPLGRLLATGLAIAVGIAGLGAAADRHLLRRLTTWAAVQAGLAVLLSALPESAAGRDPGRLALAHLGASAAAVPLLFYVFGRVVTFARTADLAGHGGLLSATLLRAQGVLAAAALAIIAGLQAPVALLGALAAAAPPLPRLLLAIALAGWVGTALALWLAAYRIVRGARAAPGVAPPDLGRGEGLLTAALLLAVALAFLFPAAWAPRLAAAP